MHNAKNEENELKTIRENYKPIQPTVSATDNEISYLESKPSKEIEDFIYCYWQLKTQKPLKSDYNYRVVSDGCIDIFFDHKNPRSEEHTSELQSRPHLVCRLLLEKKK